MDKYKLQAAFVKEQVDFHRSKAERFEAKGQKAASPQAKQDCAKRAESHRRMAQRFQELLEHLESLPTRGASGPMSTQSSRIRLTPEELDGLPEELLGELSLSEADRADFAVQSVIDEAGGILSLDKIIVALYRKTGEVSKRTTLNARIYRMTQRGDLYSVPGKKGVYSTRQLTEDEASELT